MAAKRASSNTQEQKRKDIEKYAESIFYSARYSGELTNHSTTDCLSFYSSFIASLIVEDLLSEEE